MDEWVVPHYEGLSSANIAPSILRALTGSVGGVPLPGLRPEALPPGLLDGVRRVVLLIIDALGDEQLCAALEAGACPALAAQHVAGPCGTDV